MSKLSCDRMIRLLAHPNTSSLVNKLSLFHCLPVCRLLILLTGEGGEGEQGAKSNVHNKAWSSIYHSILSDIECCTRLLPKSSSSASSISFLLVAESSSFSFLHTCTRGYSHRPHSGYLCISTFLGPKWHSLMGSMPFYGAQKSLDFQGPTPPTCPCNGCCPHQKHKQGQYKS